MNIIQTFKNLTPENAWLYIKYQVLTKAFMLLAVLPFFYFVSQELIHSTGRVAISSGDFLGFFLTWQGTAVLFLGFAVLTLMIVLDIYAFIIISSASVLNYHKVSAFSILKHSIKTFFKSLKPSTLCLIAYVGLIVPLAGIGLSVAPFNSFAIPNFIAEVIFNTPLYHVLYVIGITLFIILGFIFIFTFHFLALVDYSVKDALLTSARILKNNIGDFLENFILRLAILLLPVIPLILVGFLLIIGIDVLSFISPEIKRFIFIFIFLTGGTVFAFFAFLFLPLQMNRLTELFFKYCAKEGIALPNLAAKFNFPDETILDASNHRKYGRGAIIALVLVALGVNLVLSAGATANFAQIFKNHRHIDVVAHRAGGNLAAENSLLGLERAIEIGGVSYAEFDVQRNKDGLYIINHDKTFKRLSGDNRYVEEVSTKEIAQLKIKDEFNKGGNAQPIATLAQFLNSAKDKIGLFIELKGPTADKVMADDVIALVKAKGMEQQSVILSLDYELISYVEKNYPEINTGFLYFFSFGKSYDLISDYLIMEEAEATAEKIASIHANNKKAIVWTVNTPDSMKKFVSSTVDGIITDKPEALKSFLEARNQKTDLELIVDFFMGDF